MTGRLSLCYYKTKIGDAMSWADNLPMWTIQSMLSVPSFSKENDNGIPKPGAESFKKYYEEGKVSCNVDWSGVGSITVDNVTYTNSKPLDMKRILHRGKNLEDHDTVF